MDTEQGLHQNNVQENPHFFPESKIDAIQHRTHAKSVMYLARY
jgi:hypothetical protein